MPKPENIIGKGFDKHPENINKEGRPPSIKNELKQLLVNEGELPIPAKHFIRKAEKDGEEYYIFKIPTQQALAAKLISMAMGRGANGFQALKLMIETFDGKPKQEIDHTITKIDSITFEK